MGNPDWIDGILDRLDATYSFAFRLPLFIRPAYINIFRFFYRVIGEIITRFAVDQNTTNLPPMECQLCGGPHHERLCPNSNKMGF